MNPALHFNLVPSNETIHEVTFTFAAQPRALPGAGEDREAAADAVPHAHQPRDAGVRLPRLGHAHRDPLHGGARVRCQAQDDLQVVLPAAQVSSLLGWS